jgi:aminopeptidase N
VVRQHCHDRAVVGHLGERGLRDLHGMAVHRGKTAQQMFDAAYRSPATVWKGKAAKPGRDHIFDPLTYVRSAMTLHQVLRTIGDAAFFPLVKDWPKTERNGNATNMTLRIATPCGLFP